MLLLYLWLSFQRISLTFYGYVLRVWYILFCFFFVFGFEPMRERRYPKTVFEIVTKLNQSMYQCVN